MHVELSKTNEEARTCKSFFILLVIANNVAGILAEETFNALTELLTTLHIDLFHTVLAELKVSWASKCGNFQRLLVIKRNVGDQVANDREGTEWSHCNSFFIRESIHTRHTHQTWTTVNFRAARTALASFAIPTDCKIWGLRGLKAMNHVEYDFAFIDLNVVIL